MVDQNIKIELNAVIVTVTDEAPQILINGDEALPSGPFETEHRTLEQGLRAWARLPLGYVEQLYTFADRDRRSGTDRMVSIGYLALMRMAEPPRRLGWSSWYKFLPWEDHRTGMSPLITKTILPSLEKWRLSAKDKALSDSRGARIDIAFPRTARQWNEELVLQRYELLWEAGLIDDVAGVTKRQTCSMGQVMAHDHRRIVATAMARLRAKIKYRPVVFELLPDSFTLLQLQSTVEALGGVRLHKQNFRRLIESQGLVEETGAMSRKGSGRPAKLFAFRREVLQERAVIGTKLPRTS